MSSDEQERLYEQKNVAFYQTFLSAWIENRMETDKQILTLSSLAIGLLMFFYDKLETPTEFVLWFVSVCLFLSAIITILCIFKKNCPFIEGLLNDEQTAEYTAIEKDLQKLTSRSFACFILGVVISFSLAVVKSGFLLVKP